jgi:hypothetical protein
MKNSIALESSINVYDVVFNEVQYEVQTTDGEISGMFRVDGFEIEKEEREAIRDFVYNSQK